MISIVVPVYNVEPYIEACVQSILEQTYTNFEVILVDDGSTDKSGEICDAFQKRDQRIRVVHKINGGLSSARNYGIEEAKGDYVCFVDSDDMLLPDYLKVLHQNAVRYAADVSWCGYTCSEEQVKGESFTQIRDKKYLWDRLSMVGAGCKSTTIVVAWNKLIRIEVAKKIKFPEGCWHEDEFWIHRLLNVSECYVETTEPLYYYRQRPDSIVGRKLNLKHLDIIDALEERIEFSKEMNSKEIYIKTINAYRQTIIIQYHTFGKKGQGMKLKLRFWKSFFQYPVEKRLLKSYLLFSLSTKLYYQKYWEQHE